MHLSQVQHSSLFKVLQSSCPSESERPLWWLALGKKLQVAQEVKVLAAKANDLSLIPGTHVVERMK